MPIVNDLREKIDVAQRTADEAKHEIGSHERECAVRYAGFQSAVADIKTSLAEDRKALATERSNLSKVVWSMIGSVALLAASLIGWLLVQLYTLEPLRIQAQDHKAPPAAVAPK